MNKGLRWLFSGLAIAVAAGFISYDYRDKLLRYRIALSRHVNGACAALPKLGLDGRYQTIQGCPWEFRTGDKQTFSGRLFFLCEDPAVFAVRRKSTNSDRSDDDVNILNADSVAISEDEAASGSHQRVGPGKIDACGGPPMDITVVGWRLHYNDKTCPGHCSDIVLIDRWVSAAPVRYRAER